LKKAGPEDVKIKIASTDQYFFEKYLKKGEKASESAARVGSAKDSQRLSSANRKSNRPTSSTGKP